MDEKKCTVDVPCDRNGKPWKLGDHCLTFDGEGSIAGYDGKGFINVDMGNYYEWYHQDVLKRSVNDAVQDEIDQMKTYIDKCGDDTHINIITVKSWICQIERYL